MAFKTNNPMMEFDRLVVGENIMTPNAICYGFTKCGTGVFEISWGAMIGGGIMYGVSIRDDQGEYIGGDLFESEAAAIDYVDHWRADGSAAC